MLKYSLNQIQEKLDNNIIQSFKPVELNEFLNNMLRYAADKPSLVLHENITPKLLSKVSTDNLTQYCNKLFFECSQKKNKSDARSKLISLTYGQSILQRLDMGILRMFSKEFPNDKDIKSATQNRLKIEEGISSRNIAINTIAGTSAAASALGAGIGLYATGVTIASAGGVGATGVVAPIVLAPTLATYGAGLILSNVAAPAAVAGGATSIAASAYRSISHNFRKNHYVKIHAGTRNERTYDLNNPTDLRRLCSRTDVHLCPDYPSVVDYAIKLSNEIYGIPRSRDSASLAALCENESLSSMSPRNEDVIDQANNLSTSFNGGWPIYSDISPLESLCANPNLFALSNKDMIIRNVLDLAVINDEYKVSKLRGTHLAPLKKLASHKHLSLAPSGLLEALKLFCDRKGLSNEKWAFSRASQSSAAFEKLDIECKRLKEIIASKDQIIDNLVRKVDDLEQDFISINQNISQIKFNTIKFANKIKEIVQSGQAPSRDLIDDLSKEIKVTTDKCEEMQKKVDKVVKNTEKMNKRISTLENKTGNLEAKLSDIAKQQGYNNSKISKLEKFSKTIKDDILGDVKTLAEKCNKLAAYDEVLQMLSSPEAMEALSDILEEHHTRQDSTRDMNALENYLSDYPKISGNPQAIKNVMDFADGYKTALMHLYKIAPTFTSGVVKSEAGRKAIRKNLLGKVFKVIGSAMPTPAGQVGAALLETSLEDSSAESSRQLMSMVQNLGMIEDEYSIPRQRSNAQKTRVACDIISTHAIEMALHLVSDPQKLDDLLKRKMNKKEKISQYSRKVFDGFQEISRNMTSINTHNDTSILPQDATVDPKAVAAAYMTKNALTSTFFGRGEQAAIKKASALHAQMRDVKPKPSRIYQATIFGANAALSTAGTAIQGVGNILRSRTSVFSHNP